MRGGDEVAILFDYADDDEAHESVRVIELGEGLEAYRLAVRAAIEDGRPLDERHWVQENPG